MEEALDLSFDRLLMMMMMMMMILGKGADFIVATSRSGTLRKVTSQTERSDSVNPLLKACNQPKHLPYKQYYEIR